MASENPLDPIQQLTRVIVGGIFPGREGVEEVNRLDAELGAQQYSVVTVGIRRAIGDLDLV
ncbi:hypothetical protein D522_07358 [Mycobacterium avium subsp. paratuberculosis S5]|nr:hypothetical protein D522_07358 [Mycobacterium avium subsp. paratuberculosis S5]